jgi:hypothetical protein
MGWRISDTSKELRQISRYNHNTQEGKDRGFFFAIASKLAHPGWYRAYFPEIAGLEREADLTST